MWSNGNELFWHRSPVWLLLRVVLEQVLSPPPTGNQIHDCGLYKRYMIFFMSKILERYLGLEMDTDFLSVMNDKIAQRLIKLYVQQTEDWLKATSTIVQRATETLEKRWKETIASDTRDLDIPTFDAIAIERDLSVVIPQLDRYLGGISERTSPPSSEFDPPTPDIWSLKAGAWPASPIASACPGPYKTYNLALFEEWVAKHLDAWLRDHIADEDTCDQIRKLIHSYNFSASEAYRGQPEGMSVMFLTVIELWIACDKSAIRHCPLIAEYKPEIPRGPLGSLVLKSAVDMQRLFKAEHYLTDRENKATSHRSILYDMGTLHDFGPRFVLTSHLHRTLLNEIETKATRDREAKRKELRDLKIVYEKLMGEANSLNCQYRTVLDKWGDEILEHLGHCLKCSLTRQAKSLRIQAHEWPLPRDQAKAQCVVFELQVPVFFGSWRDSTLHVLQKVLAFEHLGSIPPYKCRLASYIELGTYYRYHSSSVGIELVSSVKPEGKTHRLNKAVNVVAESDVCVETGPVWKFMDHLDGSFLEPLQPSTVVSKVCTFDLPKDSGALKQFPTRTWQLPDGADPNRVISSQHQCPQHLSVDELKALCSLNLGQHTQWPNLLVQLAMPQVDANKVETFFFVWQLAEQCGHASRYWRRATHEILEDNEFVSTCLENLQHSLARVKESWESRIAVAMFTLLSARLLSIGSREQSDACLQFLSECRVVSCQWQRTLREEAFGSQHNDVRLDFARRAAQAALICMSSFDVDDQHLVPLLEDPEAAKIYLECLITLRDTEFSDSIQDSIRRHLDFRCRRLIKRSYLPLQEAITENSSICLDLAVRANWTNFSRAAGHAWKKTKKCWLETKAKTAPGSEHYLSVHFNLITGELLVNGLPRGRLPSNYEAHATYKLLFGHTAFEALPSTEPQMRFTASKLFHGYEIQFLLGDNDKDLAVRAKKDGQMWELLPNRLLLGILPSTFTRDYVYWYDASTSTIVLRPVDNPWEDEDSGWVMTQDNAKWTARNDYDTLVFPTTGTAGAFGALFEPLERLLGLNIVFNKQKESLSIHIPRLNLEFSVNHSSYTIHSRQYKGMYVDKNQGIETIIGLQNKLVLCDSEGYSSSRMVLIPRDTPRLSPGKSMSNGLHPEIRVDDTASSVEPYHLNNHLGQLAGNGSLRSRLFLAELHAKTSSCVPDPFTGHTGTEVALDILNSAAVRSLGPPGDEEVRILERISRLSPRRTFYPDHLRVMQDVGWSRLLSPLAQSDLLAIAAAKVYEEAKKIEAFYTTPFPVADFCVSNRELVKRSIRRSFASYDMMGEDLHQAPDVGYSRDPSATLEMTERTRRAIQFGQ